MMFTQKMFTTEPVAEALFKHASEFICTSGRVRSSEFVRPQFADCSFESPLRRAPCSRTYSCARLHTGVSNRKYRRICKGNLWVDENGERPRLDEGSFAGNHEPSFRSGLANGRLLVTSVNFANF